MSIKSTDDGETKKNIYICIKTSTLVRNNKRIEENKTTLIRREKENTLCSNQIIGLDGESKSKENGFCCC